MDKVKKLNAFENNGKRGWFIGHFHKVPELNTQDIEAQLINLKAGQAKECFSYNQKGTTVSMVLSGKIKNIFPKENKTIILEKPGDFVVFQPGVIHTWKCLEDALILSFRWPSLPGDPVKVDKIQ